jgi:hypothetical protein
MKTMPPELLKRIKFDSNSVHPVIKSIEYPTVACEDCEQQCENRVVRVFLNQGYKRTYCTVCKFNQNPTTGKFDMTTGEIQSHYSSKKTPRR